ncbi:substrate-binding periplasmic protein [Hydrogenophaga sp. OTU3427]|uniref:substrate-binding periplasmic protein n=1 Tax=Hydrogenophaga sp. OTU3427 TaxID=3043856 RepID=UPI00313B8102
MPRLLYCLSLLIAALLGGGGANAQTAAPVRVYNTYLSAPFTGPTPGTGLASELVAYLNQRLGGEPVLQLETLPRTRLLRLINADGRPGFSGAALFLHPSFIGDPQRRRFLWTHAFVEDRNVLVLRASHRPVPHALTQLQGLRFGGIHGNRYGAIDDLVATGQLLREDVRQELFNLRKLARGRIDVTQTNLSYFRSMSREAGLVAPLVAVPRPDQTAFGRHIMLSRDLAGLHQRLETIVAHMPQDGDWQAILRRHGQSPVQAADTR